MREPLQIFTNVGPQESTDLLGYIPSFIDTSDPRDIVTQINDRYAHGGGWVDMEVGPNGWHRKDLKTFVLSYPDDPDLAPFGFARVQNERIFFYRHGIVAVACDDNSSFRVARLD